MPTCTACHTPAVHLCHGITMCPRCDTVAQNNGMRAGPPNHPGTRDGWFRDTTGGTK